MTRGVNGTSPVAFERKRLWTLLRVRGCAQIAATAFARDSARCQQTHSTRFLSHILPPFRTKKRAEGKSSKCCDCFRRYGETLVSFAAFARQPLYCFTLYYITECQVCVDQESGCGQVDIIIRSARDG
jgi:hypothetical protein